MQGAWRTVALAAALTVAVVPAASAADDVADLMQSAIDDVQAYWETELPAVYGMEYTPIPEDRLYPYSSSDPPPACGAEGTTPYEEVAGNAFYCPDDDFVAWDEVGLITKLREEFGDFTVALVVAHEWGHVIQERTGTSAGSTTVLELQADCFAGAWARHATTTRGDELDFERGDLEQALSGYLYFADPIGTDPRQEGAHGSAFDRIAAFSDGFSKGAERCKEYATQPPIVTEIPFSSSVDLAREGNLPFDELLTLVRDDLDAYWESVLGETPVDTFEADATAAKKCGGRDRRPVAACPDGVVAYDPVALRAAYDKYGDFAVATLMAEAWADAAILQDELRPAAAPSRRAEECMAGAWAGDVVSRTRSTQSLSPGDLDEAVAALLAYKGRTTSPNNGFVRFRAFRTGFAEGAEACGIESTS